MYYLKQSYSDQIIICNPKDEIICRVMHYDFNNEEEAIQQAEVIVNSLNETEETPIFYFEDWVEYMLSNSDYTPEEVTDYKDHYQNLESFEENTKNFIDFNSLEETKDIFENYEEQPENVKSILEHYGDTDALTYKELAGMQKNLETIGYTFDYGLDAQPFNLRKI